MKRQRPPAQPATSSLSSSAKEAPSSPCACASTTRPSEPRPPPPSRARHQRPPRQHRHRVRRLRCAATSGVETPESGSVVAIAINAASDEALPAAVFDADGNSDGLVTVPAGLWYLVTFDPASGARRSPDTIATDGKDALRLDQATERVSGTLDDQRSAFTGLLDYFVTYQTAYSVSLDTFTNGYTKQLFDPSIRIDADHARLLHLALDNVDAAAAAALDGVSALGSQSSVAAPGAGPSYGLYDYLKDKIRGSVKARERAKERARMLRSRSDV